MSFDVTIPSLGESVTEATIGRWLKSDGDPVAADEAILELESDKANMDLAAEQSGVLRILKPAGETVAAGDVVGRIEPAGAGTAAGSGAANALMGYMALSGNTFGMSPTVAFSVAFALNMYFQSFGAVSIVKVNAAWFHLRERGTFGGIFASSNGGASFSPTTGTPSTSVLFFAWDPNVAGRAWVGLLDGLWFSDDSGATWDDGNAGFTNPAPIPLDMDFAAEGGHVFVVNEASNGGLWRSFGAAPPWVHVGFNEVEMFDTLVADRRSGGALDDLCHLARPLRLFRGGACLRLGDLLVGGARGGRLSGRRNGVRLLDVSAEPARLVPDGNLRGD